LAKVKDETISCFACGHAFERASIIELDPCSDSTLLADDAAIRRLSAVECPRCGYMETRAIPVHGSMSGSPPAV
jgi:Zn ribbon nucleic-acid-binding protein